MVGLTVKASEIAKEVGQFHVFCTFLQYIFEGLLRSFYRHFLMNLRAYYLNSFFINFNFEFRVLAQKCRKPCVNGVLKFQFFFLNLSSKVLAGVGVRTLKYPYMDIYGLSCYIFNVLHFSLKKTADDFSGPRVLKCCDYSGEFS